MFTWIRFVAALLLEPVLESRKVTVRARVCVLMQYTAHEFHHGLDLLEGKRFNKINRGA